MPDNPDNKEVSNSITISQGRLFKAVHVRGVPMQNVVLDIGEGNTFLAAPIYTHNGQYVLYGLPGELMPENISSLQGQLNLDEIKQAITNAIKNDLPLSPNFIDYVIRASQKGSRVLLRHK